MAALLFDKSCEFPLNKAVSTTFTDQVSGFMVVRLPEFNMDSGAGRPSYRKLPCLGEVCYAGVERLPWYDIVNLDYKGMLPAEVKAKHDRIWDENHGYLGLTICQDLSVTYELLEHSNQMKTENELIAVRSKRLIEITGAIEMDSSKLKWLGYDVVALAEWSLLAEGLFIKPHVFPGWETHLNEFGLFHIREKALEYGEAYLQASHREEVEPLGEDLFDLGYGIDAIEVGRVITE
jgi:hypothetical protein